MEIILSTVSLVTASIIVPQLVMVILDFCGCRRIDEMFGNGKIKKNPIPAPYWLVTVNYIITGIITYFGIRYRGIQLYYTDIYTPILCYLIIDIFNYVFHRSFHHPVIYRVFHRDHHKNKYPSSFREASYADVVDWTLSMLVYLSPMMFIDVTPIMLLTMQVLIIHVQLNHSGYYIGKIPGLCSPVEHWGHHLYPKYNYCELTVIPDILFGTYLSHDEIINRLRNY